MLKFIVTMMFLLSAQIACDLTSNNRAFLKQTKDGKFATISLSEQVKSLSHSDSVKREQFLADHPEIIYIKDLKIPSGIEIVKNGNDFKLVAKRNYSAGEIIYKNQTLKFPKNKLLLVRVGDEFVFIDNLRHTVNRGNAEREFYYFDSYMNHSCAPNTVTHYVSPQNYEGRALRNISRGEELTCDYAVFDTTPDGEGFTCECGSPHCRGFVY